MACWILHSFEKENDYIIKDILHFFPRFSNKHFRKTLCFHILALVLWKISNSSLICITLFCDPNKGHCESPCWWVITLQPLSLSETLSFLWGWETMEGFDGSGHLTQNINRIVEKCHQEGSCPLFPHLPRTKNPLHWFGKVSLRQEAFDLHLISWLPFLGQDSKLTK